MFTPEQFLCQVSAIQEQEHSVPQIKTLEVRGL